MGDISADEPPCTIAICDDQQQLREALVDVLSAEPGFSVVGQAVDGDSCLDLVTSTHPDVLILDVKMPGGGPDLVRRVRLSDPAPVVVVFSAHGDEHTRAAMLAAGADDYLVKTGRLTPLVAAVADGCRRRRQQGGGVRDPAR